MAEKKVGTLVKEARTEAGLTQDKLADKVGSGLTAAMISECERGKADLTNAQLKKIATVCGVTQASLLNAPKNIKTAAKKTAAEKKTASSKTSAAKTSSAKTSAAKTTSKTSSSKTSSTGSTSSLKVSAAEKKLLEAYREADSDQKKIALKVLKGEYSAEKLSQLDSAGTGAAIADGLGGVIGDVLSGILGGK